MDGHLEILKSLIDSLTVQLTNILIKIESIFPVLTRIQDEVQNENKISSDTLSRLKDLQKDISLYQDGLQNIPSMLKTINEMKEDFEVIKKLLLPVNRFTRLLLKPLTIVICLLMTIGCFVGVVEAIQFFLNK